MEYLNIFCCGCGHDVAAKKVKGDFIYSNRADLSEKILYFCEACKNYVGTHKDSGNPLGSIPTKEIREKRMEIHKLIDPLWRSGKVNRGHCYQMISQKLGYEFHTAQISSLEEAELVIKIVKNYARLLD